MRHLFVLALLVAAACAPEVNDITPSTTAEVAGAKSEPLLAYTCNSASYCAAHKAFLDQVTGTHWTWGNSPCGTSVTTWHGSAPGGRLVSSFLPNNTIEHRQFEPSQQMKFISHCTCVGNNFPRCTY